MTDEPEYIDYPHMANIGNFMYKLGESRRGSRPSIVVDGPKPADPHARCANNGAPRGTAVPLAGRHRESQDRSTDGRCDDGSTRGLSVMLAVAHSLLSLRSEFSSLGDRHRPQAADQLPQLRRALRAARSTPRSSARTRRSVPASTR